MSRLRDVILVIGDNLNNSNQSTRLFEALSNKYEIFFIDYRFLQNLKISQMPLHAMGVALYNFVQAHCDCDQYRILVELDLFPEGSSLIQHMVGRDLNIGFVGVFGEGDCQHMSSRIKQTPNCLRLPVHYISELERTFNIPVSWSVCDISTSDVVEARAKLYEAIETSCRLPTHESAYHPLFSIQSSSSINAPVFCIPGAGDNIASFTGICAALGFEYPVYGMQPRGLDGQMVPHHSVEAAARSYIEAIKTVRKQGPVHLLGHSFGGWVAFEIAANLADSASHDHRLTIASVTIIDSEVPGGETEPEEQADIDIVNNYIESIELVSNKRLSVALYDWNEIGMQEKMQRLHRVMIDARILPARSRADILLGPYNTFSTALRTHYSPRHCYSGELRLVLAPDQKLSAEQNADEQQRISSGWQKYTRNLQVFRGGGNHISILSEPHVSDVIGWWKARNNDESARRLALQPLNVRTVGEQYHAGDLAWISTTR